MNIKHVILGILGTICLIFIIYLLIVIFAPAGCW